MHSPDLTQENVAKLQELFPGCVTEATDDKGELIFAVDFDQLRQELSGALVEGERERYRLDWPGKNEAISTANTPISKTLRPIRSDSMNFDETRNLFVEGTTDALKLMQDAFWPDQDDLHRSPVQHGQRLCLR